MTTAKDQEHNLCSAPLAGYYPCIIKKMAQPGWLEGRTFISTLEMKECHYYSYLPSFR